MTRKLTALQTNLLDLAKSDELSGKTYREIADQVGASHPYTVQQAITSLVKKGVLARNEYTDSVTVIDDTSSNIQHLIQIPVMGFVSCGPATALAETAPSGHITVSSSAARVVKPEHTFALVSSGESMTSARINGKPVEDGDYVIVEKRSWGEAKDGEYVVSRFNDANNLKKFKADPFNRRIILLSESHEPIPPIIISEDDIQYFAIEGVAVDVVKGIPA